MKNKIYFITYGDKNFNIAKKHIIALAKHSGFFEESISFGKADLDSAFKKNYSEILNMQRGGGYWIWKHRIIENFLQQINKNDLIVYSDAGATFNYKAKKRFFEYIDIINGSDYGNFRIECEPHFIENEWTITELFDYFQLDKLSDVGTSTQLEGGHMIIKKSDHTDYFMNEFKKVIRHDQYLITDKYNKKQKFKNFKENRHDQSIFSLLSKKYGCEYIENETEYKNRPESQYDSPFLSVRRYGHGLKDKVKFYAFYNTKRKQPVYFPN
jgi:hypothetical protein